jgi:superfamily II DNA/RNA helicase
LSADFQRLRLRPELEQGLIDAQYAEPRPIQAEAIPAALSGKDVLGLAQTGTGKTAAFVLPVLQQLLRKGPKATRGLVITPTRELADQVNNEFERLGRHTRLQSAAVYGGVSLHGQERALRKRPEVLVACPGRLLDLASRGAVRLDQVEVLVLDEADHMFDMGFLPDLRRILAKLPERRQNLMFSATMPKEIRKLADKVLWKPVVVELEHSKPAETIEHALYPMPETAKAGAVRKLLQSDDFRSAIVFLRTKRRAKQLAQRLERDGYNAVALQGNMSQGQRTRAMQGFRDGSFDVLVATDIAARGIDIEGVSHVINYDVPDTPAAYTHRIGRTGRSGLTGAAFTFVTPDDHKNVRDIQKLLGRTIESRTLDGQLLEAGGDDRRHQRGPKPDRKQGQQRGSARPARRSTQMGQGRKAKAGAAPGKRPLPPKPARAAAEEPATPVGAIAEEAPPKWSPPKRERGEREQQPRTSPYERRNRGSANADDDAPKPYRKPARKRSTKARGQRRGTSNSAGGARSGGGGRRGSSRGGR